MKPYDVVFLLVVSTLGLFLIATSIPLGSPHIFAYCLLSQIGTVPVDTDAFRIFCLKEPTESGSTGLDGGDNNPRYGATQAPTQRPYTLYEYEAYDRFLPQSSGISDRETLGEP